MLKPITPRRRSHPHLYKFRRSMNRKPTKPEAKMARMLRAAKIAFKKQQVFYDAATRTGYIADFWLPEFGTIVECDGPSHRTKLGAAADLVRDLHFARASIKTVRADNDAILEMDRSYLYNLIKPGQI